MTALSCSVLFGRRKYIQVKEPLEFKAGNHYGNANRRKPD